MAKPYQEGKGWSMRQRFMKQNLYVSSCRSSAAAKKKMAGLVQELRERGQPRALGPHRTTLAQALQDYALERLPFMKGARQEANRINKFLRGAGLGTLVVSDFVKTESNKPGQRFDVTLRAAEASRRIPRGLATHRGELAAETTTSDALRDRLAGTLMADVTRYQLQAFMDALRREGREPATLQLERALVRRLFNYASRTWHWGAPTSNPAAGLTMPTVKNERDRVMSELEQQRLDEAIHTCRNALVGPTLTLLRETAMRSSEPLQYARWRDVDWDAKVLNLTDSKTNARSVPLSPKAIEALRTLQELSPGGPEDGVVRISYEALKASWVRACERAGVTDLRIHDLRHTAATRLALKTGNIFLVQALTGHQTLSQLARYVNVKASDVVAVMHGEPQATPPSAQRELEPATADDVCIEGNVVRVQFGKR